jgi:hypothetical protein
MMKVALVRASFINIVTNSSNELLEVVSNEVAIENIRNIIVRVDAKYNQGWYGNRPEFTNVWEEVLVAGVMAIQLKKLPGAQMSGLTIDLNGSLHSFNYRNDISIVMNSISHLYIYIYTLTRLEFVGFDETNSMDLSPLNMVSLRSFSTTAEITTESLGNLPRHLTSLKLSACRRELRDAIIDLLPTMSELRVLDLNICSFQLESLADLSKLEELKMTNDTTHCTLSPSLQKLHIVTNSWSFIQLPFIPTSLTSLIYEIAIDMDIHISAADVEMLQVSLDYIVAILSTTCHISANTSVLAVFTVNDTSIQQAVDRS